MDNQGGHMLKMEKVTLTLPKELMKTVRQMAPARGQSRFVAYALEKYVAEKKREKLRAELTAGYKATSVESLALTREWEALDEETWLLHVPPYQGEEPVDDPTHSTE
jgi:metal-responsive CopG/Arc/MetJ family transcriptional regulator